MSGEPAPMRPTRSAPSTQARLVRLGLGADAERRLAEMGLSLDQDRALIEALIDSADASRSLTGLARVAARAPATWAGLRTHATRTQTHTGETHAGETHAGETHTDEGTATTRLAPIRTAARLAAASDALAGLLVTDPGLLAVLTGDLTDHEATTAHAVARVTLAAGGEPARMLARAQRRGVARIAARDLLGLADTEAVAGELSALAEGVLAAALDRVRADLGLDVPLAVVAMGKLGGAELNYVSDVDVLFVGEQDLPAATRLAEAFLRLVGSVTPEGRAYEIDPTLRPEGRDGPLVRSLDGYRAYYERWAAPWEFQALLKARPVVGAAALGRAFIDLVTPLVWPDRRPAEAVGDIQRLKGVTERSHAARRAGERELKLGPGGLRDVEFTVQLLQLVHGRHDPSLREGGTLPALRALAQGGYVGEKDARLCAEAYLFLRAIEHRLQLRSLRRTHTLPADHDGRQRLARTMGYADAGGTPALERFESDLRHVRAEVRRVHERLFYRPLLGRLAEVRSTDLVGDVEGRLDTAAVRDRLVALGFARPDAALRALDGLVAGSGRRARLLRVLLPAMLPVLAGTPDPDGGLMALRSLAKRLDASPTFLGALRDRPPVAELLAAVLGRSPLVGRWLERQPEVLPLLADEEGLTARREPDDYRRLAEGIARRHADEAHVADALRRLARRELARTAIRQLSGGAAEGDVAVELSGLGEACLSVAAATVTPPGVALAVIGLGGLGGRELSYGSDLDVLFVFEPSEAREQALHAVERLIRLLAGPTSQGRAFAVDPGLRPEGKDGPLARSLASTLHYYERLAQPWELQALTQARPVAGDLTLGRAFIEGVSGVVYPTVFPRADIEAIRQVKRRVEAERGGARLRAGPPRPAGRGLDVKLGPGGLIDIEWTVQLLQLVHGGRLERLRRTGTGAALAACEEEEVLTAGDAKALREGWRRCVRVRHALFLAGLRDHNALPLDPQHLRRVMRLVSSGSAADGQRDASDRPEAVTEVLAETMRDVRDVHDRLFYDQ